MDDWTEKNRKAYTAGAKLYLESHREPLTKMICKFLFHLRGTEVLSAGCGPGIDEKYLKRAGLSVTGIDLSDAMLEEARKQVPDALFRKMDMRRLEFPAGSFDGIYASASLLLLHSFDIPCALNEFSRTLRQDGLIYLSVKEGAGDLQKRLGSEAITQTLLADDEVHSLLFNAGFEVIESFRSENRMEVSHPWLNYFCRKGSI